MKENTSSKTKKSKTPLYISLVLLVGLIISYFAIPTFNEFSNEAWEVLTSDDEGRIRSWVEDFGWFGPVLIVLAMILQMFLLIIPSILLMIVAILAYGPIWGSLISVISVALASTVGYIIGKLVGRGFIARLMGGKSLQKVSHFITDYGFWAVAITRLNPFLSNDAISFVTGIMQMAYWKFIGASLVGISPLIVLLALAGENTDSLKTGLLWGSIVCLIIFIGYVWWDKKKKN